MSDAIAYGNADADTHGHRHPADGDAVIDADDGTTDNHVDSHTRPDKHGDHRADGNSDAATNGDSHRDRDPDANTGFVTDPNALADRHPHDLIDCYTNTLTDRRADALDYSNPDSVGDGDGGSHGDA